MNLKQEWDLRHIWFKVVIIISLVILIFYLISLSYFWSFWGIIIVLAIFGTAKYGFAEKKKYKK